MEDALKRLFKEKFGEAVETVSPLKPDGSHRKLYRLKGRSRVVIGAAHSDRRENAAFLGFSRHFHREGLPVPEIYAEDLGRGVYLEEDLGDDTLFQILSKDRKGGRISAEAKSAYEKAVGLLPRFQITAGKNLDYGLCHPRASFDKQSMMWDLNYFKYYFLKLGGIAFNEQDLEDDFNRFSDYLLEADGKFFLYRDFQSRNIMVRGGAPYFIDYQGGRRGPLQYDIASLLNDAKADLPFAFRDELLARYLEAAGSLTPIDQGVFLRHYPGFVLIRILQACGAYGLRGFHEKKSHFLQSIPYAIRNIEHLLRSWKPPLKLPALTGVLGRMVASSTLRQFGSAALGLTVRIRSFSYRGGLPRDDSGHGGGFVFDCRGLPNPGRQARYSRSTGKDPDVVEYLAKEPAVDRFLASVYELVDQTAENYRTRNFTDLAVAFGCTGGQHRSVYCAELLARHLRERFNCGVELRHEGLGS